MHNGSAILASRKNNKKKSFQKYVKIIKQLSIMSHQHKHKIKYVSSHKAQGITEEQQTSFQKTSIISDTLLGKAKSRALSLII